MKKLFLLPFLIICFAASAQPPFELYFGDSTKSEKGTDLVQFPSGSIYYLGYSNVDTIGGVDLSLTKFDKGGNMLWQKFYGSLMDDFGNNMIINNARQLIITGTSFESTSNTGDAFIMCIDTNGSQQWFQQYGDTTLNESLNAIIQTASGNYIACGFKTDTATSREGNDFYIINVDTLGSLVWEKQYGSDKNDYLQALREDADGSLIFVGDRQLIDNSYNPYLLKLDDKGEILWEKQLLNNLNSGSQDIIITSSGDYLVLGESSTNTSTAFDIYLSKISKEGVIHWQRLIEGSNEGDAGFSITERYPNRFLITGYAYNDKSKKTDIILLCVDSAANELSKKYYGGTEYDMGYRVINSGNDSYLIAGMSYHQQDSRYALIYDQLPYQVTVQENKSSALLISTNFLSTEKQISFNKNIHAPLIILYGIDGSLIYHQKFNGTVDQIQIDKELPSGIYLLEIITEVEAAYFKLVVSK